MQRGGRTTRAHLRRRACRIDDFQDPSVCLRVAQSPCIAFVDPVWIGLDDKPLRIQMAGDFRACPVRNETLLALQIPMSTLDPLPDSNQVNNRITLSP